MWANLKSVLRTTEEQPSWEFCWGHSTVEGAPLKEFPRRAVHRAPPSVSVPELRTDRAEGQRGDTTAPSKDHAVGTRHRAADRKSGHSHVNRQPPRSDWSRPGQPDLPKRRKKGAH